jgi:predicted DNA-binding transcriptional regulator YafY
MARAPRLLALIQLLRQHRHPVSGAVLAAALGISLRTLYRDIATLQAEGATIDGEPGVGYLLRPGFLLPPLMLTEEEIEALVLGTRWVARRADHPLGEAARRALGKIVAVLPADLKEQAEEPGLLIGPAAPSAGDSELPAIRQAIREERKVAIRYQGEQGGESRRTIWPFALGFFERLRMVAAWCELRQDFRHFRTDRIAELELTAQRYPRRRQALIKEWRAKRGIAGY